MDKLHSIIEGCKQNDRLSQEKLYRQFYPGLFAMCKTFFNDNHDVLTALNNGMMNVFKNISAYNPGKGDLFNWAYTIVRYAAINHFNSKDYNRITHESDANIENLISTNYFADREWDDVYKALEQLPNASRAVTTLFYLEGYSVKEIAEQLNISAGTVKWHLNESRNRLKAYFKISQTTESA